MRLPMNRSPYVMILPMLAVVGSKSDFLKMLEIRGCDLCSPPFVELFNRIAYAGGKFLAKYTYGRES